MKTGSACTAGNFCLNGKTTEICSKAFDHFNSGTRNQADNLFHPHESPKIKSKTLNFSISGLSLRVSFAKIISSSSHGH